MPTKKMPKCDPMPLKVARKRFDDAFGDLAIALVSRGSASLFRDIIDMTEIINANMRRFIGCFHKSYENKIMRMKKGGK